jgi:pimeloyl-ACP methyl ester carboxylesterase
MNEFITNGKKLAYIERGQGFPVVLLHGYLETKEVWQDFAGYLATHYRVIIPDIPGHGGSDTLAETHSMELMAQSIQSLLQSLGIEKFTLIGHSMGGYVMLAFAQLFPEKLTGMVLFHSSVFADTDEKKKSRLLEIEQIENGHLDKIGANHLPKTFATQNWDRFQPLLGEMAKRALAHDPKGVCALIRGMMERPDRQELIRNFEKPMLFIFGKKDNFISVDAAQKMALLNSKIEIEWFVNSGHMGFLEEPDKTVKVICGFLKKTRYL